MSNAIALQRSFTLSTRRPQQPSNIVPNTDYLDLSYDETHQALWIYLSDRAPVYVSLALIQDLLDVDNVFATSLATNPAPPKIAFKITASKRRGIFSLGGDLAHFRYHIDQNNRNALAQYAHTAVEAIWTNTQAAGTKGMTTISLVQGEAQGGGFEAALSSHVLIAEKGSMFGFPEALFGMFPGMGGYALLSARVSSDCAKRLIGSTNRYPAEMLHEMGVIDVLAEKGQGKQTLEAWMRNASPESTLKYRNRFAKLDRIQLTDSVEEWVEQALCLNQRQLRTMGYILEAQKRASQRPPKASVTPIRKMIGFDDLSTENLITDPCGNTPAPLLITPKSAKQFNEGEFILFIKHSRPWIYENLSRNGAVLLRGFPSSGSSSLNKLAAAMRTCHSFSASRSVPTPAGIHENVFEDDRWHTQTPQRLHNAYSDCTIFPAIKALYCDGQASPWEGVVTLANTRAIYQYLDNELILDFERRGITYRRLFPNGAECNADSPSASASVYSWQRIFKASRKHEVEKKCRNNGLSYQWNSNGSIEVWNSAPACISHPDTSERLWFNQLHLFGSSDQRFVHRKAWLSKLFSIARPHSSMEATFSDGTPIPRPYVDEIAAAHRAVTLEIQLAPGDFLILDNALTAQGRHALGEDQRLLMTMY